MSMHASRPVRPKRPAKPQFTSMILVLEGVLVLFAALTAHGLESLPGPVLWSSAGAIFLALVVLSRLVTVPGGYVAGSIAQVLVLACGFVLPAMFALGGLFVVLWVVALRLGGRIDRERAAYDAPSSWSSPTASAAAWWGRCSAGSRPRATPWSRSSCAPPTTPCWASTMPSTPASPSSSPWSTS
jgi:hypothetical protein